MDRDQFIGHAIHDMISKNVSINFCKYRKFGDRDCSYFSTNSNNKLPEFKLIYRKSDKDEMFETFVHEYCHFLQWKNRVKIFQESDNSIYKFWKWLEKGSKKINIKHVRIIQAMEMDCDKKAVSIIAKYDLPVDIPRYIQKSNSYILSYNYVYEKKDFSISSLALNDSAVDLMPTKHLRVDQLKRGFPDHEKLILGDD